MSEYHFILNPIAGRGNSTKVFSELEQLMQTRGVDYSVSRTEYAGHAVELTRKALEARHGCIVAAGGDGTVREVAQEMMCSPTPMFMVPCGTGNDMARALHIPNNPEKMLDLLLTGSPRPVDAGLANDLFFFNIAGMGFDVDVTINTEHYKKSFRGLAAYLLGLFHSLFKLKLRRVKVKTERGEEEYNALLVAVANGTHFGGGMNVAPYSDPTDGLFDVCILHDVSRLTVLGALTKFVKGKHTSLPVCTYYKANEVTITGESVYKTQLDGEIMGQTPVTLRNLPSALNVIMGDANPSPKTRT